MSDADLTLQGLVDHLMPWHAQEWRREESARVAAAAPDFLVSDWTGVTRRDVMTVRKAASLVAGICSRNAWVTEYEVGEGAARDAIDKARKLIDLMRIEHDKSPTEEIRLKFMAKCAQEDGWDLPAGFPSVADQVNGQNMTTAQTVSQFAPAQSPVKADGAQAAQTSSARGWLAATQAYVVSVYLGGRYSTAKELFSALWEDASNPSSPFGRGDGVNRGKLTLRKTGKAVSLKSFQNHWSDIKSSAK